MDNRIIELLYRNLQEVFGEDGGLADGDAQLEQLAMDP
jgi:hypothetical protein